MRYQRDGFSIDAAIAKGRELPDWYLDCPALLPGDEFYLHAFNELSTERQLSPVPGPIPWSSIIAYAFYMGVDPTMINLFRRVIREMDAGFLQWAKNERDRQTRINQPKKKAPTPTRTRSRK